MAAISEATEAKAKWQDADNLKPYTDSSIIIIGGPKRNCKSLLMAATIILKLVEGETVWSNMPVNTSPAILNRRYSPSGRLLKYAETKPLNWDLLYMLDESFVEGTVAVDEIGYQASARQSQSTSNRLINGCMRQVGHRCLDLLATARSFYRIDYYLRDEVDVYIQCEDLRFSPWGIKNNVPGGVVALLKYYDISGSTTGKSCYNGYRYHPDDYYQEVNFYGTAYWDCFDTKNIVSLEEAFTPVQLDLRKRRITNKNDEEEGDAIRDKLLEGIAALRKQGRDRIPSTAFWGFMKDICKLTGSAVKLGRLLPRDTRRVNSNSVFYYDFSEVRI